MVSLLAFTDMHGKMKFFEKIRRKSKKADIVVCCGDITTFEEDIEEIIAKLDGLKKPVIIVHGNHESPEKMAKLCDEKPNLFYIHKTHVVMKGIGFFGFGGEGFSEISHSFEKTMGKMIKEAKKLRKKGMKIVFISHAPPYESELDLIEYEFSHLGNKSVRRFIENAHPNIAFSGHFHENFGKEDFIGNSRVVNPGPEGRIYQL